MLSLLYGPTLTSVHDYWKNHSFDSRTFVGKAMSLLFNTLSRFVIAFLLRSKQMRGPESGMEGALWMVRNTPAIGEAF